MKPRTRVMAFVSLGLVLLAAGPAVGQGRGEEPSERRSRRDWAVLPLGPGYLVVNNVWNMEGDASGKSTQKWTYIAFLARTPVLTGPLDIGAFARFLQGKNLLGPNVSITGLELGNEIVTGSGSTEVRAYEVTVR